MPGQSSIDPLASAVAAAVAHPAVEASQSEPSSLSQAIAMRVIDALAETLVIAALLGELGLVLGNVFARAYFHHSFLWADEVARLSLSILAFIGGAVAYRRRDHAFVRVVLNLVPRPVERACLVLSDVIVLFVVGLTGIASAEFIGSSWGERTPIFQIPAALIALPLPVGMALLALYAVNNLYRENRGVSWGSGAELPSYWLRPPLRAIFGCPGLVEMLPSSWRLHCSSSRSSPACRWDSFCFSRQRPISGRRTPPRSLCCRRPWSTAPAISFFWPSHSSFSPGWSWSAVASACGSSGSFTRWSATGAAGSSKSAPAAPVRPACRARLLPPCSEPDSMRCCRC